VTGVQTCALPICPDLVLEEFAQRLEQLQLHMLGQAAHVVVALDRGGRTAVRRKRFDDVRIKGALGEEFDLPLLLALDFLDGALEDLDEFVADDLALALGIGDALELAEEDPGGIDDPQGDL